MPKVLAEYKEEAKKRIIEAAQQVFSKKGYHETTMEDIGKILGVSKGALYLYFASKDELFKAIGEKWQLSLREILLNSLENEKPITDLENLLEHILKENTYNLGLSFEFISEASRDASIRKILKENYQKTEETLHAFLEKKKTKTPRDTKDNRLQSAVIIALFIGLMGSLILGAKEAEVKNIWAKSIKTILE